MTAYQSSDYRAQYMTMKLAINFKEQHTIFINKTISRSLTLANLFKTGCGVLGE